MVIELSREETLRSLALAHAALEARGIDQVTAQVASYDGQLDQRYSVDVTWHYFAGSNPAIATSHIRYFCRFDRDDNVCIEMMEYLQIAFPELGPDLQASRFHH